MKIKTQDYNDITVTELQGELTDDVVEMAKETVKNVIGKIKIGIVFDMSNVNYIDSAGLEMLMWARDYCHENKTQLKIAGLDENCKKLMEITRMESCFDHHEELAEAVKSFA